MKGGESRRKQCLRPPAASTALDGRRRRDKAGSSRGAARLCPRAVRVPLNHAALFGSHTDGGHAPLMYPPPQAMEWAFAIVLTMLKPLRPRFQMKSAT